MVVSKDNSCTTNNACPTYEFMLLNVARLLLNMSRDKSKIKFIGDLCSNQTLFIALCETFLSDVISDFEISISNYNIIRCDRYSRIGGGVCIYLKQSICYDLLLSYSNSVCDLLIIRLIQPELIVILIYRPPSCSGPQFEDVILKMKSVMFKLASPLPNIIMLGDFNLPTMSWSQPGDCFISRVFCPFVESLFLQQYVNLPTRKNNILDLVFCNSELIDSIDICDTFISDHCLLTVNTSIPVCFSKYHIIVNPPSSIFEMLNFRRCNWLTLQCALRDINWGALFSLVLNEDYFNVFMREITKVCTKIVPKARSTHCRVSSFFKERKGMMKRRTKLRKSLLRSHSQPTLNKLMTIEEDIITSHINELSHEEAIAVAKIKEDPNFFFRYAKRFSITKQEIGPLYSDNGSLTNDKKLICKLLLEQFNSAFSIPLSNKVVLFQFIRVVINNYHLITAQYLSLQS